MSQQTSNKFSLRSVPARCGWCWITNMSIRRDGRRSFRSQLDRLHGADSSGVGEEGGGRQRQAGGGSDDLAEKLKALERENRELRQANEILRKAAAYFAQAELDQRRVYGSRPWH